VELAIAAIEPGLRDGAAAGGSAAADPQDVDVAAALRAALRVLGRT